MKRLFLNLFFPEQKMSVAEQNRRDIINELDRVSNLSDLARLEEILRLCASDFETNEFVGLLRKITCRRETLAFINENLPNEPCFEDMLRVIQNFGAHRYTAMLLYISDNYKRFSALENLRLHEALVKNSLQK